MGAVGPNLPLVVDAPQHRCLESEVDQGVDEKIHQVDIMGLVDPHAGVEDAVESRRREVLGALLENGERLADEVLDVAVVFVDDDPGQSPVDLAQRLFAERGEPGYVHDLEEENELEVMAPAVAGALLQQPLGNAPVGLDEMIEVGQLEEF